jgi:two-component sensor histidine kinase
MIKGLVLNKVPLKSAGSGLGIGRLELMVVISLTLLVIMAAWLNSQATSSTALAAHTLRVERTATEVLSLGVDAETGQRGFLLTGDPAFLQPYDAARAAYQQALATLDRVVSDNADQTMRVAQLKLLYREKFDELALSLQLARAGRRDEAIAGAAGGKAIMDRARMVITEVVEAESRLLLERQERAERQRFWATLMVGGVLAGLVILGLLDFSRARREQFDATSKITQLDDIVRERTAALEREAARVQALLGDVTHRVGNNLGLISALLNLQIRQSHDETVKEALTAANSRIHAIAAGHRKLVLDAQTDEVDGKPYIENLLHDLEITARERKIALNFDVEDVRIPGRDAVSYVIIINELVTNALKHAFCETEGGVIKVRFYHTAVGSEPHLEIVVEDDGRGGKPEVGESGLGKKILSMVLLSLSGTIESGPATAQRDRPGFRSVVRIPLEKDA